MKSNGNRYTAGTKAEIALRACREDMTLSELSSEYGVSSAQINRWKKTLIERASELFDSSKPVDTEKITDPLYREIGRLKMDIAIRSEGNRRDTPPKPCEGSHRRSSSGAV